MAPPTIENKLVPAAISRYPGSVRNALPKGVLRVAYRKYTMAGDSQLPRFNFVFLHGTGMNKGIFNGSILHLFQQAESLGFSVGVVVAVDAVNHGHSAVLNQDHLGDVFNWRDFSYDVERVLENEPAFFAAGARNIVVGHSMSGTVSLYLAYLKPGLLDCAVLVNPVCFRSAKSLANTYEPYKSWNDAGFMETEFDVPAGQSWWEVVRGYMRKHLFYRNFTDELLDDLLDDERPPSLDKNDRSVRHVALNTTKFQTLATYFGSLEAFVEVQPVFGVIKTPVYRLLGERDLPSEETRKRLETAIPSMKTTLLKGLKHNMHGEQPDLFRKALYDVIVERITAEPIVYPAVDTTMRARL